MIPRWLVLQLVPSVVSQNCMGYVKVILAGHPGRGHYQVWMDQDQEKTHKLRQLHLEKGQEDVDTWGSEMGVSLLSSQNVF